MFSHELFGIIDKLINNYFDNGYENHESYCYEELINIIKNMWIIIDKAHMKYTPNKDYIYKSMAIQSFKKIQCKRLICYCPGNNEWCEKCIEFDIPLYELKKIDNY
jgi:hypothetical protein